METTQSTLLILETQFKFKWFVLYFYTKKLYIKMGKIFQSTIRWFYDHCSWKVTWIFKLGQFPIIEVMVLTFITTVAAYPNPYTRMGATAMIDELVQECGPVINSDLCDYKITVCRFSSWKTILWFIKRQLPLNWIRSFSYTGSVQPDRLFRQAYRRAVLN